VRKFFVLTLTIFVLAACGSPTEPLPALGLWTETSAPAVGGSTDIVFVDNGAVADGTYWAWVEPVLKTNQIVFHIARAYFGETCQRWAQENGMTEGCMNDYYVDTIDTALLAIADDASVTVALADAPGISYSVSTPILKNLILTKIRGPKSKYHWVDFPFIVRTENSVIVDAQQKWVP
jgi:hypothetical protein